MPYLSFLLCWLAAFTTAGGAKTAQLAVTRVAAAAVDSVATVAAAAAVAAAAVVEADLLTFTQSSPISSSLVPKGIVNDIFAFAMPLHSNKMALWQPTALYVNL